MDVRIAAKFYTPSLIFSSSTPLSSSLSSSRVRSLRREFLGCGYSLRRPSLRTERKCKKLGLFLRASLDPQSILVVVAVIAVPAITVVYFNHLKRKKSKEISNPEESNDAVEEMEETGLLLGDKLPKQVEEAAVMNEEALIVNTIESHDSKIIVPSINGSVSSRESEVSGYEREMGFDSDFHEVMVREREPTVSVPVTFEHKALLEHIETTTLTGVENGRMGSNGIFKESIREELHTFYDSNEFETNSVAKCNGLSTLSSGSIQGRSSISLPIRHSSTKGAKLMALDFKRQTDRIPAHSVNIEVKTPLGLYKDRTPDQTKNAVKSRGFFKQKNIRDLPRDGQKNLAPSLDQNEMRINVRDSPSRQLKAYNRMLRDGRLTDCIQLLEDLERNSWLDMDKVYHSGFFKTCKNKKAVREAFAFTKLIPNPTLSTFNMLMSVCASSQDSEGAFQVLQLVQEAGLEADCKLYTTLISTCAKSGKVDTMFKVFHEMVNAKVEPNDHTYGALIDGCGKAGQVAKAFGAYGIMRSKNVKPDRVIFNALITACGQSGAVDRAFDVLAEMRAEAQPIDPDHVTVGALIAACANSGQVDRAREVYNMVHEYNIKGTPELYTIAVNSCSQAGDWDFACSVYNDMEKKAVVPDEMFLSALIDVAGHAGKLDAAFEVLQKAREQGLHIGTISYSALMGACSNAKNWQKALELYEDIKSIELKPTVSTMNALLTALCDGEKLEKAQDIFSEMKRIGLCPNTITYSILLAASEKKDDIEVGLTLLSQAKKDRVVPNLVMCRCLIAMCLRRFEKACKLGEPVLSFSSGRPQIESRWTSLALMVYREAILAGLIPKAQELSLVLGCLRLPHDASLRHRLIENLGISTDTVRKSNLCSLLDGFGEYDPRAISLLEEAASLGIVPCVSFKDSPVVVDAREWEITMAEVYLLTVLKGLKHRLAAGARLPNINILLPVQKTEIQSSSREKTINVAGRISQAVAALLRRLGLSYQGNESYGKIRINGVAVKIWFLPKFASSFGGKSNTRQFSSQLGRKISYQQRSIRTGHLSLD